MDALKQRIKEHYDGCSPSYQSLWGPHIHHGLWRPGQESLSKEEAQIVLVDEMIRAAKLRPKSKVLDVGCGVGGTSIKLASELGCDVTGVSLSPVQIGMAKENLAKMAPGVSVRFLEMDGEKLDFPGEDGTFDAVWISEALSHFPNKELFFMHALRLLKPGGKWVCVDWFKADNLGPALLNGVIADIERGMLLPPIRTVADYVAMFTSAGGRILFVDDISAETAKTWDSAFSRHGDALNSTFFSTPAPPPPPHASSTHTIAPLGPHTNNRSLPRPHWRQDELSVGARHVDGL